MMGSENMMNPFRLDVCKMKCGNCDLIVLIEKRQHNWLGCPVCGGIMEHMSNITVKEEQE